MQRKSDADEGRKKYEDKITDEHFDSKERSASEMASEDFDGDYEGCYSDDDGDGEPCIRGMMKGPKEQESISSGELLGFVRNQVPHGYVDDIPGDSRSWAHFESDSLGDAWCDNIRDDSTPDEYIGGEHRISWGGSRRGFRINPKAIHPKTCEMCLVEFKGTENARYCNECRAPKYCKMRRDAKLAEEKSPQEPVGLVTPAPVKDVRALVRNFLRHGEKTPKHLRDAAQEAGVDVVAEVTTEDLN